MTIRLMNVGGKGAIVADAEAGLEKAEARVTCLA